MSRPLALTLVICSLLLTSGALAETTLTWTMSAAPLRTPIAIDFEGSITGISDVTITIGGYGGGQRAYCQEMSGDNRIFWLPYRATLNLDDVAYGGFAAPLLEQFEPTAPLTLLPDEPDWSILHDGRTILTITTSYDYEFDYIDCYPSGFEAFTAAELTVTVVCDSAVPLARSTWGAIKSIYR